MRKFTVHYKSKFGILCFGIILNFVLCNLNSYGFCQENNTDNLEFNIDATAAPTTLPKIFKPSVDLSGRGVYPDALWPQGLAAPETLDIWRKDLGFTGIYRIQYNLWEINEKSKEIDAGKILLDNYERVIKAINNDGGVVILDIFGTPAGLGKVLDKKSLPWDLKAFKELVKAHIRNLSCNKKYNIWYEVWTAPDLDVFFLGGTADYLNLYKAIAEGIKELEAETGINIPLGGPSASWWFQNADGNTIFTPEKSLVYELIKFCSQNKLPLDFITWHAYSTDPKVGKENTPYNNIVPVLIRDWLTYFGLDKNVPLIVDEWNFDNGVNLSMERKEKSSVAASYVLSRLKNMSETGLDYQLFYSLEDFQNQSEGVVRNVGVFLFEKDANGYKSAPKAIYNVFKMLKRLGGGMLTESAKTKDEFVGLLASKDKDDLVIIAYNYIDQDIAKNYLSRNIVGLNEAERDFIVNVIKSGNLRKILSKEIDISGLQTSAKVKTFLSTAQERNKNAVKFMVSARNVKLGIKNLKGDYYYQKYVVDSSCGVNCDFVPVEAKDITAGELYQEDLSLSPYSVVAIMLKKKPQVVEVKIDTVPQTDKALNNTAVLSSSNAIQPQEGRELKDTGGDITNAADKSAAAVSKIEEK
ncbi:MAG: hypothetical protein KKG43_02285 [Candidatus Omnitrophica bacterium]|nr:hypothetical protein [Candidatus Omnitrophota bacterium]MBU1929010.1 hypothetical protein [Candidatus Omnitrophota bacterium]MBU2035674.1 hypothetical protein [Candidatus Omnitrophota bacterium]MBU2221093.1 hypothetical protein [Candidatus Omnitrophota bacterium]MBU2258684.1 hypothetical protein [Candidatus Omnitrophota bacterium]